MTTKEFLLTAIVALIIGIILVHYEDFINALRDNDSAPEPPLVSLTPSVDTTAPSPPIVTPPPKITKKQPNLILTQLKTLVIHEAAVTVSFWLESPDKKHFSTQDRVTLYYQIKETAFANRNQEEFYFTLFNISPTDKLFIVLTNKTIKAKKIYALPTHQTEWQPEQFSKKDQRLRLEAGKEYFKAIVTTEPISSWLKFLATDIAEQSQRKKLLGAKALWINVD
jgi:DNA gyrase/topoisomerase IV subunit A